MKSKLESPTLGAKSTTQRVSGKIYRSALFEVVLAAALTTSCGAEPAADDSATDDSAADDSAPNDSMGPDVTAAPSETGDMPGAGSTSPMSSSNEPGDSHAVCARAQRLGTFTLYLDGAGTLFSGSVYDAVNPLSDFEVLASEGSCELLGPRVLVCEPACPNGEVCSGDNVCVAKPTQVSAGIINLTGLAEPWEIKPNGITLNYSGNRSEPNPGFDAGDEIGLSAAGADFPAFTLSSWGVSALTTDLTLVPVASGSPVEVVWDASGADPEQSKVLVTLTVNVHGSTTQWIECMAEDNGALQIPAPLVTELVDLGLSGFPIVELQRLSVASVAAGSGCVDFRVSSGKQALPLEVDGLTSCNDTTPCPDAQTCNAEKVCEAL